MQDYFEREISNMERELRYLKTSSQRSAGSMVISSQTLNLSVPLQYIHNPPLDDKARAEKWFEVVTEGEQLIVPTLSWYFQDLSQASSTIFTTRMIELWQTILPNGNYGVYLYFIGSEIGDNNDAERLKNGETINVDVDLTIRCTNNFVVQEYTP